jgi:hypothetical protein
MTNMTRMMDAAPGPWANNGGLNKALAQQGTRKTDEPKPSFAAALQGARKQAWDPHEVWLSRVKQPRDIQRGGR